jgi:hypothetical protein
VLGGGVAARRCSQGRDMNNVDIGHLFFGFEGRINRAWGKKEAV